MKKAHALPPEAALRMIAHHFSALTGGLQANISRHLQKLQAAGVLNRRKDGAQVFYAIADPSIYTLCEQVCGSLEKRLAKEAKIIGSVAKP
jgi:ArsR family transcriptional regulator